MKTGLVLEGGAMRGMYTAGALDVFLKEGVHFQGVMGVSAGALFGVNFLSGQAGRVIRYCKKYNPDHHYMGLGVLLHTGEFVNRHFAYDKVPRELDPFDDQAFQASGVPFYAVVTNLDTGNAEYLPIHSVFAEMDVLRASGSMPFFAQPVPWQGRRYLDGGVADSIPYEAMGRLGYDRRVVILTRDLEYRKRPMPRAAVRAMYGKYPVFCQRLLNRHTVYNASVARLAALEKAGEVFVLRPSQPITVRRLERDPAALQAVYDLGVKDAHTRLAALKDYLSK